MELTFNTKLKGTIALTDSFQLTKTLREDNSLYKFIWARKGTVTIDVDHQLITLQENDIISLTNLHHLEIKESEGDYMILLFNSNFYCIYGNDHEVSCSGFLFNGTSRIMHFRLSEEEKATCEAIITSLQSEFQVNDNLKEEMLRILLKHFIIHTTRLPAKTCISRPTWKRVLIRFVVFTCLWTNISKKRNKCRITPICYANPLKPFRTFYRYTIYLPR